MNLTKRARGAGSTDTGTRLSLLAMLTVGAALVGLTTVMPALAQSATTATTATQPTLSASISLNHNTEGAGTTVVISGSGLVPNHNVNATFGVKSIALSPACTTNSTGKLSGCSFVVPNVSPGSYVVTVSDGTNSPTASFTIPAVAIPESTLLVTLTSVGLSLVTQVVTRRVVNLNAERKMKAEVSAFNKEKREATLAKDKVKLEKLKKREVPMRQAQAKVSSARLKVTAITFIPLLGVYYLMASFLGGFNVVVAHSPIPIPLLVGPDGTMVLFWWYLLSSFAFSSIISKLLHTTP
jgi:uncharacterized membrane protein (DUF106 family)